MFTACEQAISVLLWEVLTRENMGFWLRRNTAVQGDGKRLMGLAGMNQR